MVVGTSVWSCKFVQRDDSSEKALGAGTQIGEVTKDPNKQQALIYVANAPADTDRYRELRKIALTAFDDAIVSESATPLGQKLRKARLSVEQDAKLFGEAVQKDTQEIQNGICSPSARIKAGAFLVTNEAIRNGTLSFCGVGGVLHTVPDAIQSKVSAYYLQIKTSEILESSPLSDPGMLTVVLNAARELFPAQQYEYSLVLKSHGSSRYLAVPKIAVASTTISTAFLKKVFNTDQVLSERDVLDGEMLDKEGLRATPAPDELVTVGITKTAFVQVALVERPEMFFNLVMLESCNSDLSAFYADFLDWKDPNLGYLFTSDAGGLGYKIIPWGKLSDLSTPANPSLRGWLHTTLSAVAKARK